MFSPLATAIGRFLRLLGLSSLSKWVFDLSIYPLYLLFLRAKFQRNVSYLYKSRRLSEAGEVQDFLHMFRPVAGIRSPIRIGGEQDGGYVVPAEVFKADALFSPGVAQNSDFEFEFATRGIPCFLADESVDGPAREHQNFFFIKRFIGPSSRPDFLSMQAWIQDSGLTGDAFALQMDIEGAEWEVLADADWLSRFRFLVIEFHNLEDAWDRERLLLMSSAVKSLTANFDCVLVVPNNFSPMLTHAGLRIPSTIEVTLVRKGDPSIGSQFSADKAQAMVRKNNPRLRDIDLGCISNSCLERGLG